MSNTVITYSSELLRNFKQAEPVSAESKFEALQTDDGCSLLFSIGSDGRFYVIQQTAGHATGWTKIDLSSACAANYPAGTSVVAKTFAVAQNRVTGAIQMALVLTVAGNDDLFLSLGNSNTDTKWLSQPKWVRYPFDDATHPLAKVAVVNVFVSEASDGEYIAVDVLRNPADALPVVFRYFVDPTKKSSIPGQAWTPHDVANDLDASKVTSCLGRRARDRVDGLYTLGEINGHTSLIFQPLYNPFNPRIPANPARLVLPENASPSAIASVAVSGNATDLYVACDKALYAFPYDAQQDGASPVKVLDNPIFQDVSRLFACASSTRIIVWGINRANQVFYTACDRGRVRTPAAWTYPVPIVEQVDRISPYVNRVDDGNTFFVHAGAGGASPLRKAAQAPDTTTWKLEEILLSPTGSNTKASSFGSYTTRVQVTDADKNPLPNAVVHLGAVRRCSVYVNNLYYVLGTAPIPIKTDATGALVIVERIDNLLGTTLQVHGEDGTVITINPMDKPFQRAAALTTVDTLSRAVVTNPDGTTKPLVAPSTSQSDKQTVVDAIASLTTAYRSLPAGGASTAAGGHATAAPAIGALSAAPQIVSFATAGATSAGLSGLDARGTIDLVTGDLFRLLEGAVDYVVHLVKDTASEVWHFVAEVGGKVYRAVLDAAEKVLGALEYVFNAVKTAVEDLIQYLAFLFDWEDFLRTKDVTKKLLKLHIAGLIDGLQTAKADFNHLITDAKGEMDSWAGVQPDTWQPGGDNGGHALGYVQAVTDVAEVLTAPGMFLFQHFLDNVNGATGKGRGTVDVLEEILDRVIQALEDEGNVFTDAVNRIKSELLDGSAFQSLSLSDVVKKLTAIVADALLNTSEDLVDTTIDVMAMLVTATVDLLDTPIWIPVVSDILEYFDLTIEFSMLDVICMIGAVPATIAYKAMYHKAPFSSGDGFTDQVLAANDLEELRLALSGTAPAPAHLAAFASAQPLDSAPQFREAAAASRLAFAQPARVGATAIAQGVTAATEDGGKQQSSIVPITISAEVQTTVFIVGHLVGGVVSMMNAVLAVADALAPAENKEYATAVAASGAVSGVSAGLAAVLAQPYPIKNTAMSWLSTSCTGLTLLGKIAFKIAPSICKGRSPSKIAIVGAGFDGLVALIALVPTCYHFWELAQDDAGYQRSEAIINETSNVCVYLSRICSFAVQVDKDPESKAILAGIMGVLIGLYGGLQISESFVDAVHPEAAAA